MDSFFKMIMGIAAASKFAKEQIEAKTETLVLSPEMLDEVHAVTDRLEVMQEEVDEHQNRIHALMVEAEQMKRDLIAKVKESLGGKYKDMSVSINTEAGTVEATPPMNEIFGEDKDKDKENPIDERNN